MSTDHQEYSTLNQSTLIRAYAAANDIEVVATYADPGKSGLTLKSRPGLSRLLADIIGGQTRFEMVLVYDVSRWGRFQDADESAHYEFLCRKAGIRVVYCAEQFGADGTPFGSVLKALKRAMAGEYSRELSVKVLAGKSRIASLGFRVGGIAGFGLRRMVLEDGHTPGIVLRDGQKKSIQTDRVILIPGPPEELEIIQRIYREYIHLRKGERQIADDLNVDRLTCFGRRWSRNLVRTILSNEKYIGNNVFGRFSQTLRAPQVSNPPDTWTRFDAAFLPVVSRESFLAAAAVRRFNEKVFITEPEMLKRLGAVLRREGRLTAKIINLAPELPSANTVDARFGTLTAAYERLGYKIPSQYKHHAVDGTLKGIKTDTVRLLLHALLNLGVSAEVSDRGAMSVRAGCTVEVIVCRYQRSGPFRAGWRVAYQRALPTSHVLAVRMATCNAVIGDYLALPRSAVPHLPLLMSTEDDALVAAYRHDSLEAAARALSLGTPSESEDVSARTFFEDIAAAPDLRPERTEY